MADENTEGAGAQQETQETTPTYTEVEQRAMEQGWVPEDQYQGTGRWRSAEDFLDRGEFFERIEKQNKRLQSQEAVINELKKHTEVVRKTSYAKALADLRAEKKAALEEGDAASVVEIDDKIADLREDQRKADEIPQVAQPTQVDPTFVVWVNKNPWYNTNKAMKVFADEVGGKMAYSGASPMEILQEVERRTRKEFPESFTNPNKNKPGAVEGTQTRSGKSSSFTLSDEETRVMNRFVRAGVMTKEQYIADIKEARGE